MNIKSLTGTPQLKPVGYNFSNIIRPSPYSIMVKVIFCHCDGRSELPRATLGFLPLSKHTWD
nr:MAG TPA_asm: hypothetical protein [Bacteriophage sp.]